MSNIVNFSMGLDRKAQATLNKVIEILDYQSQYNCMQYRMAVFPSYHSLTEIERVKLDGVFVGMLFNMSSDLKALEINDNFKKSDFAAILEITEKDLSETKSFSTTIPFKSSIITIVLNLFCGRWVVSEFYVNEKSGVQRAFEIYSKTFEAPMDQIFKE